MIFQQPRSGGKQWLYLDQRSSPCPRVREQSLQIVIDTSRSWSESRHVFSSMDCLNSFERRKVVCHSSSDLWLPGPSPLHRLRLLKYKLPLPPPDPVLRKSWVQPRQPLLASWNLPLMHGPFLDRSESPLVCSCICRALSGSLLTRS